MTQPSINELRIVEITNIFEMKKRYDLQQFRMPEKARPEDPDGDPIWIRLASFPSLEKARAARDFIAENNATEVVSVIR